MSSTRYIQIDSTYRDRSLWPEPADFEILLTFSGQKCKENALDPISLAAPRLLFDGIFDMVGGTFDIAGVVNMTVAGPVPELGNASTGEVLVLEFPAGSLVQTENFYVGAVVTITTGAGIEHRRISAYRFISTGAADVGVFTFDSPFSDNVVDGDAAVIANPSDNTGPNSQIFIPSGSTANNFYINCLLENVTLNEVRTITSYTGNTRLATLDAPFGGGWSPTDEYAIRKELPCSVGALTGGSTTTFTLPAVDANGNPLSTVDDFYRGDFIRITSGPAAGDIRRIGTYTGGTLTGNVTAPFSAAVGAGDMYEILKFTRDNATPLMYCGSLVSQQETVCYEIELLSLILPNQELASGVGSRIAFYPYVLVEFANITAPSSGTHGVIYTNNPNAVRSVFKASIDDVNNPLVTAFVKIDADGQRNTMRFKPNDNLKFTVRLPNGELFRVVPPENFSPNEPNPLVQISAIFGITRLA